MPPAAWTRWMPVIRPASVRAVFSWSYRQLSPDAARLFRLLGLHPGPDISVPRRGQPGRDRRAASPPPAARAGPRAPDHRARRRPVRLPRPAPRLRRRPGHGHRRPASPRTRPIGRVLDHYLHTAATPPPCSTRPVSRSPSARRGPGAAPEQPGQPPAGAGLVRGRAPGPARRRHPCRPAPGSTSTPGSSPGPWRTSCDRRGHWQLNGRHPAHRAGRRHTPGRYGRAGRVPCASWQKPAHELGDYDQALAHTAACLTLYQRLGDRLGEAEVQFSLARTVAESQGRYADALEHAEQALRLYQAARQTGRARPACSTTSAGTTACSATTDQARAVLPAVTGPCH